MKLNRIYSVALAALIIAACKAPKKSTNTTAAAAPAATPAPATPAPMASGPELPPASTARSNGIFAPGAEELAAIQAKYNEVSLQTLNDGYAIYTGVCTNCHKAKSIYSRPEERWQGIIDNMAPKSRLTDVQKDAVYKYVLSIKATQPK